MLPQIQMVKKALQRLHTSTCIIYTFDDDSIDEVTGIVTQGKKKSREYPCRVSYKLVSYKTGNPTSTGEHIGVATQMVTLFLDPDIIVPPGSDIDVIQNGRTLQYKSSGVPAVFQSHQEISLEERVKYHG